jgi:serine/threonine-protein kinase
MGSQFTVGDLVGRGGFAEVFAVRDNRLKRDLAVKVLSPELVVNQALLGRFRREAEAIAALRHPGIVPIYDVGESGGIAYIVMPLIQGDTLRKVLEQEHRLAIPEVRRILIEVANALQMAHAAGLVHRDIKPENVMVEGPKRQILVMDFGIAKAIDPDSTGVTSTGLIVGTPHYMSPEQASGESVDARSDQYSLAVLGYRMVTGTHPFEAETTRALLYKQVFESPTPAAERFPEVPTDLSNALHRGMSKEVKDRFATIEEFAEAVTSEATGSAAPAAAAPASPVSPKAAATAPPRTRKPRPGVLIGAGIVSLLAVVAVGVSLLPSGGAPTPAVVTQPGAAPAGPSGVPTPPEPGPPSGARRTTGEPGTAPASSRRGSASRSEPAAAAPAFTSCTEAVGKVAWAAAVPLCQTEAEGGSVDAQLTLGGLFDRGQGTAADPALAAQWYGKAMEGGSGEATHRLGGLYEEGRGVTRDMARASELYLQAARRGVVPAMRAAARQFEAGSGLRKDEREAVSWYRRAAAAGDAPSAGRLGDLFAQGRGVSQNYAEAARWYTRAADAGQADAQFSLALAYFQGRGVPASDSLGLVWLRRAASQNHPQAVEELKRREP